MWYAEELEHKESRRGTGTENHYASDRGDGCPGDREEEDSQTHRNLMRSVARGEAREVR